MNKLLIEGSKKDFDQIIISMKEKYKGLTVEQTIELMNKNYKEDGLNGNE